MQESDEGYYRRKTSTTTVSKKRKLSQCSDEPPEVEERPSKKPTGIKRPRKPKYICDEAGLGCDATFTRKRNFEMHMGKVHNKPLYPCKICKSMGTRGDNAKGHYKSPKHLKALKKLAEAEKAAAASSASQQLDFGAVGTDADPSSVSSSKPPEYPLDVYSAPFSMALAPPSVDGNQHSFGTYTDNIPLIKEERIMTLQATIQVLQNELAELVKPEEDQLSLQQNHQQRLS
ncbi:hypothetical protein ABW21_db0207884 [Orbilia brochopaga]|nr:hypothetical protein ABW21_db0207884 [Drechslerella brochopaga]